MKYLSYLFQDTKDFGANCCHVISKKAITSIEPDCDQNIIDKLRSRDVQYCDSLGIKNRVQSEVSSIIQVPGNNTDVRMENLQKTPSNSISKSKKDNVNLVLMRTLLMDHKVSSRRQ